MRQLPDWESCRLVVFDVDGTLYDQKRLRLFMASSMLIEVARQRQWQFIRIINLFRKLREQFAEQEIVDFEPRLYALTAQLSRRSEFYVRSLVTEWIDRRPLPFLKSCLVPGVSSLFDQIRKSGRQIGIFSDYPSMEKLAAINLTADIQVCAGDPDVKVLKPNPKGLLRLMEIANVTPDQTVFVGDRLARDAAAARRCGVTPLIRSPTAHNELGTFNRFDDVIFKSILGEN
jgi:putative hydrolase of the HAD superfamily